MASFLYKLLGAERKPLVIAPTVYGVTAETAGGIKAALDMLQEIAHNANVAYYAKHQRDSLLQLHYIELARSLKAELDAAPCMGLELE